MGHRGDPGWVVGFWGWERAWGYGVRWNMGTLGM